MTNLGERKIAAGHYHVEGFCALKAGRTWVVKREGCQAKGTDKPSEQAHYSTSLQMVRDYIWSTTL